MVGKNSCYPKKYTEKEIALDLERYLVEQNLPADTMIAPAGKLALRYHVSAATVNRAIERLVERKMLYRLQGCGTFTARPTGLVKRLKIALLLKYSGQDCSDPYGKVAFGNFNSEMQHYLQAAGHESFFFHYNIPIPPEVLSNLQLYHYDAVISMAGNATPENVRFFKKFNIPVVLVGAGTFLNNDFHQLVYDYTPGFLKLLRHLQAQGYESFLVASLTGPTSEERHGALLEAADQLGISRQSFIFQTGNLYHTEYRHNLDSARKIGEYFRLHHGKDTAIISTSDYVAYGILGYLHEQNLEPGRDYAIASYDNFEGQGMMIYGNKPMITGISHPQQKMACEAVKLAVNEVFQPSGATYLVKIPADELTVRTSTKLKLHKKTGGKQE